VLKAFTNIFLIQNQNIFYRSCEVLYIDSFLT